MSGQFHNISLPSLQEIGNINLTLTIIKYLKRGDLLNSLCEIRNKVQKKRKKSKDQAQLLK